MDQWNYNILVVDIPSGGFNVTAGADQYQQDVGGARTGRADQLGQATADGA